MKTKWNSIDQLIESIRRTENAIEEMNRVKLAQMGLLFEESMESMIWWANKTTSESVRITHVDHEKQEVTIRGQAARQANALRLYPTASMSYDEFLSNHEV